MAIGVVGKKLGMTRVFNEDGKSVSVTVVQVEPNRITQMKTPARDGYRAIQITVGERRPNRVSKAAQGHFGKAGTPAGRGLWEFRLPDDADVEFKAGIEYGVSIFDAGQKVDVRGTTIGKGFAGSMKRHGFAGGRATHGNSKAHRKPGSIGQNQDPGRVFPGKKMAGHMGNAQRTQQNLEVHSIDVDRNLVLIAGSVPGPKGRDVIILPSPRGGPVEIPELGAVAEEETVEVEEVQNEAAETAEESTVESSESQDAEKPEQ